MKNSIAGAIGLVRAEYISHSLEHSWGSDIKIMRIHGTAFARIYWYNDDESTVYLDMLSVHDFVRGNGIGTELQEMREEIGRALGATTSCLWVKKDTWMHDWYKRRGYVDFTDHKTEENAIWMKKSLVKEEQK